MANLYGNYYPFEGSTDPTPDNDPSAPRSSLDLLQGTFDRIINAVNMPTGEAPVALGGRPKVPGVELRLL